MASVYTTKRGKNKKQKLGNRKDASNNAANKLSTAVTKSLLETVLDAQPDKKTLTLGSSEQRRKTALLKAQEKLQLTAAATATAAAAAEGEGLEGGEAAADVEAPTSAAAVAAALASLSLIGSSSSQLPADVRLDVCHFAACPHKHTADADDDKEKTAGDSEANSGGSTAAARLLLCGGCRCVSYCSAACQKADWPTHKATCKKWQAARAAQQPATHSSTTPLPTAASDQPSAVSTAT